MNNTTTTTAAQLTKGARLADNGNWTNTTVRSVSLASDSDLLVCLTSTHRLTGRTSTLNEVVESDTLFNLA